MAAETKAVAFRHAVRNLASQHGVDLPKLTLTVAQMLAAAINVSRDPYSDEGLSFCDDSQELTTTAWHEMLRRLGNRWSVERDFLPPREASLSSPFSPDRNHPPLPPGVLEQLRQIVLEAWERGPAPEWLLLETLRITHESPYPDPIMSSDACALVKQATAVTADDTVYCGYAGAAGIALHIAATCGAQVLLEVPEIGLGNLCLILAMAGRIPLRVSIGDPWAHAAADFSDPVNVRSLKETSYWQRTNIFDIAVVTSPFAEPRDRDQARTFSLGTDLPSPYSSESRHLILALARCRRAAALVLPDGFLFRTTKADQTLKDEAIRRYGLNAVIGMPRGSLGKGTSVQVSMLLFRPEKRYPDVLMVDTRSRQERGSTNLDDEAWAASIGDILRERRETEISVPVPRTVIADQDFNLSVDRYVLPPEVRQVRDLLLRENAVPLDDIAELYRPQALLLGRERGSDPAPPKDEVEAETLLEVGVADIDEAGIVRRPTRQVPTTREVVQRARKARLEPGDVLLVIKGSVGKVGFVREIPEQDAWLASQSFVVLKLRRRGPITDPLVLFRFLSSSFGQVTIQSLKVGASIPGLQMNDVRRIPVLVPTPKVQEVVARDVAHLFGIQDRIQVLRQEMAERQRQTWPHGADLDSVRERQIS